MNITTVYTKINIYYVQKFVRNEANILTIEFLKIFLMITRYESNQVENYCTLGSIVNKE